MINAKISIFIIAIMAIWFILMQSQNELFDFINKKFIIAFSLLIVFVGVIGTGWFLEVSKWDAYLAVQSSGWLQAIFGRIGNQYRLPFLAIYGFLQPILPAAIMEPSILFWKSVGIIRSSGWVILLPIILYGFVFRTPSKRQRPHKMVDYLGIGHILDIFIVLEGGW